MIHPRSLVAKVNSVKPSSFTSTNNISSQHTIYLPPPFINTQYEKNYKQQRAVFVLLYENNKSHVYMHAVDCFPLKLKRLSLIPVCRRRAWLPIATTEPHRVHWSAATSRSSSQPA